LEAQFNFLRVEFMDIQDLFLWRQGMELVCGGDINST
jgi:hypothetical protein